MSKLATQLLLNLLRHHRGIVFMCLQGRKKMFPNHILKKKQMWKVFVHCKPANLICWSHFGLGETSGPPVRIRRPPFLWVCSCFLRHSRGAEWHFGTRRKLPDVTRVLQCSSVYRGPSVPLNPFSWAPLRAPCWLHRGFRAARVLAFASPRLVVYPLIRLDRHHSWSQHPFRRRCKTDDLPARRPSDSVTCFPSLCLPPLSHASPFALLWSCSRWGNWSACMSNYKTMEWKIRRREWNQQRWVYERPELRWRRI